MVREHAILAVLPVLIALVVSLPLGYLVYRTGKGANVILAVLGVIYSIPSLALFVALPGLLGTQILSPVNVAVALAIYSVALLVRSVVDGLRSVPTAVKQSASAVGFGWFRRLLAGRAAAGDAGDLRRAAGGHGLQHRAGQRGRPGRQRRARASSSISGFNRIFYTPVIVGLVLSVAAGPDRRRDHPADPTRRPALGPTAAYGMNFFSYLQDPGNWTGPSKILDLLLQHLGYTAAAVCWRRSSRSRVGILIGHTGRGSFLVIGLSNGARAIPTLGLLVLAVLLLGTGVARTSWWCSPSWRCRRS